MTRRLLAGLALLALPLANAGAQLGLERLISNISVANVNSQVSCLTSTAQLQAGGGGRCGLYGWGVEVALGLSPDTATTHFQFALGYGHITGFQSTQPNMDLRGVLRLTPEVSLYATRVLDGWVSPYVGLHTGLISLTNMQVYLTPGDTAHSFTATALQLGATAGLALPYNFYVDVGYRYRAFQSLEWRLPRGTLPRGWPKTLNLSAMQATVGVQFDVGTLTGKKK
jgi:opacity protein-like surface antigen